MRPGWSKHDEMLDPPCPSFQDDVVLSRNGMETFSGSLFLAKVPFDESVKNGKEKVVNAHNQWGNSRYRAVHWYSKIAFRRTSRSEERLVPKNVSFRRTSHSEERLVLVPKNVLLKNIQPKIVKIMPRYASLGLKGKFGGK